MNADCTKALDNTQQSEHDRIDERHHECESAGDSGIGSEELWKELDNLSM